jgi:hypothetical protein
MLPLETKQSGGKLLPHSDLRGGVFLEKVSRSRKFRILFREFLFCVSSVIHCLTPVISLCSVLGINKEGGRVTKKLCQYSSVRKVELVVKETSQTRRFLYVIACDGSDVLEAMFRYHHVPLHGYFQETGSRIKEMCNEVAEAAL